MVVEGEAPCGLLLCCWICGLGKCSAACGRLLGSIAGWGAGALVEAVLDLRRAVVLGGGTCFRP